MRRSRPGRKSQVLLVACQVSGVWEFQVESSGGHVHMCGSDAQEETQRVFAKPGVRTAVKCLSAVARVAFFSLWARGQSLDGSSPNHASQTSLLQSVQGQPLML